MPLELGHSPASGVSVANYHRELLGYTPSPPPPDLTFTSQNLCCYSATRTWALVVCRGSSSPAIYYGLSIVSISVTMRFIVFECHYFI